MPIPDDPTYERITRATRKVEAGNLSGGPDFAAPAAPWRAECRVTSATVDANGHYPAVVTVFNADTLVWADYEAVKLRPLNGETLTSGTRYPARPAGVNGSDFVWVVTDTPAAAGGGGTSLAVQGSGGTPSHTGKDTLRFPNALTVTGTQGVVVTLAESGAREDISFTAPFIGLGAAATPGVSATMNDVSDGNCPVMAIDGTSVGAIDLTGIVSSVTAATQTKMLIVQNVGTSTVTLKHQNAGSSAANRIVCPGAVDYALTAGQGCVLWYRTNSVASSGRWYIADK